MQNIMNFFINILFHISNTLEKILFYEIFHFPLLIIFLVIASIYFSFYLDFPAIKYFKKNLQNINKNSGNEEGGLLKSKQSLSTSLASVMGLGCIGGVATAIYIGGVGSIFWMVFIAIFSMNLSFGETLLAAKYKNVNREKNTVECAPISYIRNLFKDIGWIKFGIALSCVYTFLYFMGLLGNMVYQIEEAVNLLTEFKFLSDYGVFISIIFNILILFIVSGGISKIANIFEKLLPTVVLLYIFSVAIILIYNFTKIPSAIYIIIKEAFQLKSLLSGSAAAISYGIKRGICCNEAGLGTATTPYAAMKANSPLEPAKMGSLNPFFVAILCLCTGLAIVVSGVYKGDSNGVVLIKEAFDSVSPWFSYLLTLVISILSLTVCISAAFNAQNIYVYIFGRKTLFIYFLLQFLILLCVIFFDLNEIIVMSDTLYLSVALPNLICLFCGRKIIKKVYIDCKNKN